MLVMRAAAPKLAVSRGLAPRGLPPAAVTIGNFDGVHSGHQAMLARTIAVARSRGLAATVLTFEPHPRELFAPATAPTRLTSLREKLELLAACGVDRVHVQRFSREFAALAPGAFVERALVGLLAARWVLVGEDFRYGARRAGDFASLAAAAGERGFELEAMPTVTNGGVRVSSSAVRDALASGDLKRAAALLGRAYSISGRVVHGAKLGRALGFATANVQLKHNRPPLGGIFAVRVEGAADAAARRAWRASACGRRCTRTGGRCSRSTCSISTATCTAGTCASGSWRRSATRSATRTSTRSRRRSRATATRRGRCSPSTDSRFSWPITRAR